MVLEANPYIAKLAIGTTRLTTIRSANCDKPAAILAPSTGAPRTTSRAKPRDSRGAGASAPVRSRRKTRAPPAIAATPNDSTYDTNKAVSDRIGSATTATVKIAEGSTASQL